MDLNHWTEPRKNPDGTDNKFAKAIKDFKREGHIGIQDHGDGCGISQREAEPVGKKDEWNRLVIAAVDNQIASN